MKKPLYKLLTLTLAGIFSLSAMQLQAQSRPAPIDGSSIKMHTNKALGQKFEFNINTFAPDIWIDINNDGEFQSNESLTSGNHSLTIVSQDFTLYGKIASFTCDNNQLSEMRINDMPTLRFLYCENNEIQDLDLRQVVNIETLSCYSNKLSNLDLSACKKLKEIRCAKNELTALDLSNTPLLSDLSCYENKLESLDLSKVPWLTVIFCGTNALKSLDISKQLAITELSCYGNQLTSLDCSKNKKLKRLLCFRNQLVEEEMQKLVESLPELSSEEGDFRPVDIRPTSIEGNVCTVAQVQIATGKNWKVKDSTGEPYAGSGEGGYTPAPTDAASISFTSSKAIGEKIDLHIVSTASDLWLDLNDDAVFQQGEEIAAGYHTIVLPSQHLTLYGELSHLDCSSNELSELKIQKHPLLKSLYCSGNALAELDLSQAQNLEELTCYSNKLTKLDIAMLAQLKEIRCAKNQIELLDISNSPKLTDLSCYDNKIASLELSKTPLLTSLFCATNAITALDLSKLTELHTLSCYGNQIKSLDLSACPQLKSLLCFRNQISEQEMQKLVESLHTAPDNSIFKPIDIRPESVEGNVINTEQVAIAKSKNWRVLDSTDNEYPGTTNLLDLATASVWVYAQEGAIRIGGLEVGQPIAIYSLEAAPIFKGVATDSEMRVATASGVYLLKVGRRVFKVLVD